MKFILLFISCFYIIYACSSSEKSIQVVNTITILKDNEVKKEIKHATSTKIKEFIISPEYFPSKSFNERVRFIILHYTAKDMKESAEILSKGEVSSHYLISDSLDNSIHLLVSEDKRAWHAGTSSFRGFNNLNDNSIGIEIVNKGFAIDSLENESFFPYPTHQIKKVAALVKDIADRYKIDSTNILAHSDIAPQRKLDPGPLFPWKELYQNYKIGAWFDDKTKEEFYLQFNENQINTTEFITSVQRNLLKYGYEIEITGSWDLQTQSVLKAFQYHFNPLATFGFIDKETWSVLMALNKKYRN